MNENEVQDLIAKIQNNTANKSEKDKYIEYLHEKGKISDAKWQDYKNGKNVDHILQLALIAGIAILAGFLIQKLLDEK
jgi:hypothetical protein